MKILFIALFFQSIGLFASAADLPVYSESMSCFDNVENIQGCAGRSNDQQFMTAGRWGSGLSFGPMKKFGGIVTSAPTCLYYYNGTKPAYACYVLGSGQQLIVALFNGDYHHPETNAVYYKDLGGVLKGKVSCIDFGGTHRCFGRGMDNGLWYGDYSPLFGNWSGWKPAGGVMASDPSCFQTANSVYACYYLSPDKRINEHFVYNGQPSVINEWAGVYSMAPKCWGSSSFTHPNAYFFCASRNLLGKLILKKRKQTEIWTNQWHIWKENITSVPYCTDNDAYDWVHCVGTNAGGFLTEYTLSGMSETKTRVFPYRTDRSVSCVHGSGYSQYECYYREFNTGLMKTIRTNPTNFGSYPDASGLQIW